MLKFTSFFDTLSLPEELNDMLNTYDYVFNPSYLTFKNFNYLAIRVYVESEQCVKALLFTWSVKNIKSQDLSLFFKEKLALEKVADPKLFIMNNQVWCTFNTGHMVSGNNTIGLFNMMNDNIRDYYTCIFNGRLRIEKNWCFFYQKGVMHVLYSLTPLTILKLKETLEHTLVFEFVEAFPEITYPYSLGTPLLKIENDTYGLIAHRKFEFKGKRMYLGSAFCFKVGNGFKVFKEKHFLVHSLKSVFGERFKFNKNLISCTYFSSLHLQNGEDCVIGYGVNDKNWFLKKTKLSKLWH